MTLNNEKVYEGNPYTGSRVLGPYKRKDGRMHVVIYWTPERKKTVSYPKFLMECHLNQVLAANLTVDHFDGDFTNNALENLRILDRVTHCQDDALRLSTFKEFTCPQCTTVFTLRGRLLTEAVRNRTQGKAGPFCNRRCAGKYGGRGAKR